MKYHRQGLTNFLELDDEELQALCAAIERDQYWNLIQADVYEDSASGLERSARAHPAGASKRRREAGANRQLAADHRRTARRTSDILRAFRRIRQENT